MQTYPYFTNSGTYRVKVLAVRPLGLDTGRPALVLDLEVLRVEAASHNPAGHEPKLDRPEPGARRSVYLPMRTHMQDEQHVETVLRLRGAVEGILPGLDADTLAESERPATALATALLANAAGCTPLVTVSVQKGKPPLIRFGHVKAIAILRALHVEPNAENIRRVEEHLDD